MSLEIQSETEPLPRTDQLLCEVATGDRDSFSILYAVTSPSIYGLIRKVLVDVHESGEVTQEVFLKVWTWAARYDPAAGSATSWILTIAHQCAVTRARESLLRRGAAPNTEFQRERDDLESSSNGLRIDEEHERARRALGRLTRIQRQTLALAYWDALTIDEIAASLGITADSAKTGLTDGLRRLRLVIANEPPLTGRDL